MKKDSTIINIEGIGNVLFTYKNNATRYIIRINKQPPYVNVTIPRRGSLKYATKLVATKKRDWIINKLNEVKQNNQIKFGTFVYNNHFNLIVDRANVLGDTIYGFYNTKTKEGYIKIPSNADIQKQSTLNSYRDVKDQIISSAAKQILPPIIQEVSTKINIPYNKLFISSAKTRWGSCKAKDIRLSKYLILLPDHLIQYIIIHELCHIIYPNHQKEFHVLVNKFINNREKEFDKQLKIYSKKLAI